MGEWIKVDIIYDKEAGVFIGKNDEFPFVTEGLTVGELVERIIALLSDSGYVVWNGKLKLKIEMN